MSTPVVAVVGGGISGLAAARAVALARPDARVLVLEAADRVGGKLAVSDVAGAPVDAGAENMLARAPDGVALAAEVGLALEAPATTAAQVFSRGALHPLPTGTVLGVPADLTALARSGVLSPLGLNRVPLDLVLPGGPLLAGPEDDVSVGDLVAARLGREVVERLVDPLLGGVYAGRAHRLSLAATVPALHAALVGSRSLLMAARRVRAAAPVSDAPVFVTVAGGMGRLPAAVAATPGVEVRTGVTVRALARRAGGGWSLVTGPVPAPERLDVDAVVLAVPAAPAARLLAEHAPAAAARLGTLEYAGVALVTLALPRSRVHMPRGSGLLVPAVEGYAVKAVTSYSAKWAWARSAAPDLTLVRCSLGRAGETTVLQRDDAGLVALARRDLAALTGVAAEPVDSRVTRWGGGLPQYAVGHRGLVAQVRSALAGLPELAVCGAAYDGVGIPACIASGRRAAAAVLAGLPDVAAVPESLDR